MPDDDRRTPPASPDAGLFAERLLTVIDEGRRTATYKLALLLALIDCSRSKTSVPLGLAAVSAAHR